ncbi:aminotransferase class IV family protein [Lipingzhangella sp. LS1_29]|uniref:Aminotransferase class IV family protein n=1 Tax=Lipingzhangella rawalii TaxID=2055835 RepID=A0ABU2H965_9ACTN|nr:aminotransferase class IV family protein [Lipingzhangella rawalii]MDS1271843.1 aminotransferase class IV family protein [Lipingzhangella rawalii]
MAELDGVPVDIEQLTAVALTNMGHFTTLRVENQRVRGLSLHLDRLVRDCRRVFDAELDPQRVRELVRRAVAGSEEAVIVRVTIVDPALDLGHIGAAARPRVLVTTRGAPQGPPSGLRLQSVTYRRDLPEVKHVGLFGAMHLRRRAQRGGFDDVVFTDPAGVFVEAATSNIGFVAGATVLWPRADCLPGVTMRLLQQTGGTHDTVPLTRDDLPGVDAVFATNAAVGVRPVTAIDDIALPAEHPVFQTLATRYAELPSEPV